MNGFERWEGEPTAEMPSEVPDSGPGAAVVIMKGKTVASVFDRLRGLDYWLRELKSTIGVMKKGCNGEK